MLLLALVAIAPGVSIVAGLLLMIPAFEMTADWPAPVFPRWIADRQLPTQHLAVLVERAVPVLRHLEKVIHPRWPTPIDATKRVVVGTVVVILNATLLFTPIPLSNVVPALAIVLISLAYLEEDGLLLSIALLAAVIVLAIELAAVWEDDPRRRMDHPPLVAHCGGWSLRLRPGSMIFVAGLEVKAMQHAVEDRSQHEAGRNDDHEPGKDCIGDVGWGQSGIKARPWRLPERPSGVAAFTVR